MPTKYDFIHRLQLGVEFGSKLITIPEENKIVKLQCETVTKEPVVLPYNLVLTSALQAGTQLAQSRSDLSRARITEGLPVVFSFTM